MRLIKSEQGFTLVELMIVVAIIGLLSAVAIPNFKKYQAKSKTAEAKIQLAAIYTAMQSWYSQYDNYASCLYSMGYDPSKEFNTRYFAVGFQKGNYPVNNASVNNGSPDCPDDSNNIDDAYEDPVPGGFGAGKQIAGFNAGRDIFISADLGFPTEVNAGDFVAAAAGPVDPDFATPDLMSIWSINQNKLLRLERQGY